MKLALGHGGRLTQVEERTPTTHRRLLGFNGRPLPVIKQSLWRIKVGTMKFASYFCTGSMLQEQLTYIYKSAFTLADLYVNPNERL